VVPADREPDAPGQPGLILTWNGDKRYLRDLERAGVATVPTLWIEPGASLGAVPSGRFAVKPAAAAFAAWPTRAGRARAAGGVGHNGCP